MPVTATLRRAAGTPTDVPPPTTDDQTAAAGVAMQTTEVDGGFVTEVVDALPVDDGDPFDESTTKVVSPKPSASAGAVAVSPPRAVGKYEEVSGGGLVGDWDESDLRYPYLMVVTGKGDLASQWNDGTLLLGEDELLPPPNIRQPDPKHTFRFIPISMQKRFREKISEDDRKAGVKPRIVYTVEEVTELGGTLRWVGDEKPTWEKSARTLMLIEAPEGSQHPSFAMELGGKLYAPAVYVSNGQAFGAFAKLIFNMATSTLLIPVKDEKGEVLRNERGFPQKRPYLPKQFWTWRLVQKPAGDFTVWVPEIRLTREETSDEIRDFIRGIVESGNADA